MFWAGQPLKWEVIARVGGQSYCLFGCTNLPSAVQSADQLGISFTSTHTLVNLQAGSVKLTMDFFSPISPADYTRQSLPYSYLSISVDAGQSSLPQISVFTAIDDSWTAQQGSVDGQLQQSAGATVLSLTGQRSIAFSEKKQMATWGHVVLATSSSNDSSYQIGGPSVVHRAFEDSGSLSNVAGTYSLGDLMALAQPLSADIPATFAVGIQQERAIQFWAMRSHLTMPHMRQIFGGFQVTIPTSSLDTNSAMAFMKEISTDGNVNTLADLLPRALPAFYVLAPDYIRLLLEPVLTFSKQWPESYAVHDIGKPKRLPKCVAGETPEGEEKLLLDQTSVLLWMVCAYQKVSNNTEWIQSYIPILKKYADYLVQNGLYPPKQRSAVD
ncbi:hypothetical protein NLG97_g4724 [Lecanicillium saksenae]|uniref:Uncharacterized protein n=1 Tax=Lecanicillium saksenae TaxID=468837 RepID=A0ACC1QUG9_9HYPO|nr:hypothetical protein NLG97_g4724 [Lecanicillium saksenae]